MQQLKNSYPMAVVSTQLMYQLIACSLYTEGILQFSLAKQIIVILCVYDLLPESHIVENIGIGAQRA